MPESKTFAPEAGDTRASGDAAQPLPAATGTDTLIERWFADHFHGSPIARSNEHYQHAWSAKEALKRLFRGYQP
jgi:hypothetical protein